MKKSYYFAAFAAGIVCGALVSYYFTKKHYEGIIDSKIEEEMKDIREFYLSKTNEDNLEHDILTDKSENSTDKSKEFISYNNLTKNYKKEEHELEDNALLYDESLSKSVEQAEKLMNKIPNIIEYAEALKEIGTYAVDPAEEESPKDDNYDRDPEIVSIEEFERLDGLGLYTYVPMTYYGEDDTLIDDQTGNIEIESIHGVPRYVIEHCMSHPKEETVFVLNHRTKTMYEILNYCESSYKEDVLNEYD